MSNKEESILHKVKHLIEKSKSSDSPAEAESFMLKAQEMLAKYNLDMSKVESFVTDKPEEVGESKLPYIYDWESSLMNGIGEANFGFIIQSRGYDGEHSLKIIGKPSNVEVIIYLYTFYRRTIVDLAMKSYEKLIDEKIQMMNELDYKVTEREVKRKLNDKTYTDDFINGAVHGVVKRLREQQGEAQKQIEGMRGLIRVNDDAVQVYVRAHYPRLGTARSKGVNFNANGYAAGMKAGSGLSASQGVNGGAGGGNKRIG